MNRTKDKCRNGHKLVPENTYKYPNRDKRGCRTCRKRYAAVYRKNNKRKIRENTKVYWPKAAARLRQIREENGDEVRKRDREKYHSNPEANINYMLKRNYGLLREQYDAMLEEQEHKCKVCVQTSKYRLHVDHDHETDEVRGLLCNKCNRGLGLLSDSLEVLKKAISYLEAEGTGIIVTRSSRAGKELKDS